MAVGVFGLSAHKAEAASNTWTGATNTDWATAGNWSGGVPVATNDILIPFVATGNYPVVSTDVSAVIVHNITVDSTGSGATLTVSSGGSLKNNGTTTVKSTGAFNVITGGTFTSAGTVTIDSGGTLLLGVGTISMAADNIADNGTMAISAGTATIHDFSGTGIFYMTGGTLQVSHDYKPTTPANFRGCNSVDCTSGGTVEFTGGDGGGGLNVTGTYVFYHLTVDASVSEVINHASATVTIAKNLSLNGTGGTSGKINFKGTANTARALYLNAVRQVAGTWGNTGSGATFINTDHFLGTGRVTVATIAALTVAGAVGVDKEYDGNDDAEVDFSGASLVGVIGGDDVSIDSSGYSANFDNKNVGTDKAITVTGVALSGDDAGDYTVTQPAGLTADVTIKAVNVTAQTDTKEYDGDNTSAVSPVGDALQGADTYDTEGTQTFDDETVDSGKTLTASGAVINDGFGGADYDITYVDDFTGEITTKELTVAGAVGVDKEYDGNDDAEVDFSGASLVGVFDGEDVSIDSSAYSANFDTKNVGTDKAITVTGVALSGTDAGNYTVAQPAGLTADVTARAINVTAQTDTKEYDGDDTSAVSPVGDALQGTDTYNSEGTQTFDSKDVGTGKTLTASGVDIADGNGGANYDVTYVPDLTGEITVKTASSPDVTASDKEYDQTTDADVTIGTGADSADFAGGDDVAIDDSDPSVPGDFDTKDVGTGKTVTVPGVLTGADAGNYTLVTTADINAKELLGSITADDKTYDGNTDATIATRTLDGVISGDDVSYTGGVATFDDADIGTDKTVTATGLSLTGDDAGSYTVNDTALTTANITSSGHSSGSSSITQTFPTPTPSPGTYDTPGSHGFTSLDDLDLHEGDIIGGAGPDDPDVYIVNIWGYRRLFLNPIIFSFYSHLLGGFSEVHHIPGISWGKFVTSGLFQNCETNDGKVYAVEVTGEDTGKLHWVNVSGDQAVAQDPDFFKKVFCINTSEFNWYPMGNDYTSLDQIPSYNR